LRNSPRRLRGARRKRRLPGRRTGATAAQTARRPRRPRGARRKRRLVGRRTGPMAAQAARRRYLTANPL